MPGHHHRAGALRQANKQNKRSKSSKRSLARSAGGRVAGRAGGIALARQTKADRRNTVQQKRLQKRQELLRQRRGMVGISAMQSAPPPRVVGIVSLGSRSSDGESIEERLANVLTESASQSIEPGTDNVLSVTCGYNDLPKDQSRLTLLTTESFARNYIDAGNEANLLATLDLARVCDVILFVIDCDNDAVDITEIAFDTSNNKKQNNTTARPFDRLISGQGDRLLAALKAQGLPTPVTVMTTGSSTTSDAQMDEDTAFDDDDHMTIQSTRSAKSVRRSKLKRKSELRRYVSRFATTEFGAHNNKVLEVNLDGTKADDLSPVAVHSSKTTVSSLVRTLCTMSCSPAKWVAGASTMRTHILADSVAYVPETTELSLTGYVRGGGSPWDSNALVHVPGLGTFACKSLTKAQHPLTTQERSRKQGTMSMQEDDTNLVLESDPRLQESLDMFASPDALEGEQNLIGFDEVDGDAEVHIENDEKSDFVRPAGWSDYQSAWLEAVNDDEDADEALDRGELAKSLNKKKGNESEEDDSYDPTGSNAMDLDEEVNAASSEDKRLLVERRRKEQTEHLEFPDEVEVDEDQEASKRFARYRSLKSFRKSYWDPKESLPETFASIYNFTSFKATHRSVLNDRKDVLRAAEKANGHFWGASPSNGTDWDSKMAWDGEENVEDLLLGCIPSGSYVKITLRDVPGDRTKSILNKGVLSAVALLPHENKVSVLHMGLCQSSSCDHSDEVPVKSKDVLTFRCGWRTWKGRPVFSQNNLNCDKHKFERFMPQAGAFFAASVFGPVSYTPCPVLVFREKQEGMDKGGCKELVAIGSVLGADADRIVVKRIVLTGYPVRVHKRHATVKYMFYNPDDVTWFKPAGLYTKHGLQGNIVESVGDHGTMKCLFNAPIKQHDTVCLPLYKRIFPKYADEEESSGSSARLDVR